MYSKLYKGYKMKKDKRGYAVIEFIVVLAVITVIGGIYYLSTYDFPNNIAYCWPKENCERLK